MGTMPAVRRMTSAHPDRCSPKILAGGRPRRAHLDEQRRASQLEPAECLAHFARDRARHIVETGTRAVKAIDHPAPHSLGQHRSIAMSASTWVRIWHTMRRCRSSRSAPRDRVARIMRPVDRGCPAGSSSIVRIASAAVNGAKRRGGGTSSRRMCGRWSACRRDSRARTNSSGTAFSFTLKIVKVSSLLVGQTRR